MDELELYENNGFETAQHAGKTIRRFIRSLGKQRTRLMIVLLSVAIYSTLNIFAPLYSAIVVDVIWNRIQELRGLEKAFHITWEYGGRQIMALLSLYLAAGVFYILQNFLMASFAEKLNYQLREEIAEKLHRLPLSFYDRHQVGGVMSRVTNDLDKM